MSLESKIDALTKAIETLTAALTAQAVVSAPTPAPEPKAETPAPAPKQAAPEPKAETPTTIKSHDELQTMLLMKVRDNLDNRPKIAEILNSYNAKKIGDLTGEQVQTAYTLIEAL